MAGLIAVLQVRDGDDVTVASAWGAAAAVDLGGAAVHRGRLDLVIRELAWNLVHHAGGGLLRLIGVRCEGRQGVLVECHDNGGGIGSLLARPRGLGLGLAAVQRNSTEFTMRTSTRGGTLIQAVVCWPSTSL